MIVQKHIRIVALDRLHANARMRALKCILLIIKYGMRFDPARTFGKIRAVFAEGSDRAAPAHAAVQNSLCDGWILL